MEDTRGLISTSWQQRLENQNYKHWLKVGYALSETCNGMRPYIEREAKAFHATLTAILHGLPPCTCTHTPRRRPNPHHDMSICSWARELEKHHIKGKPTWSQSDASLWNDPNVGHWEVAKLFMPYGCGTGNSCAETDATGLLNLLCWCSYYKTDAPLVERLKYTRNTWAHAATQELDATETTDAFLSMTNALQDTELIGDTDAKDALNVITELENSALIDFADLEIKVVGELRQSMTSMKDELVAELDSIKDQENSHHNEIVEALSQVNEMLSYCIKVEKQRNIILLNINNRMDTVIQLLLILVGVPSRIRQKILQGLVCIFKSILMLAIAGYLTLPKVIPRTVIIVLIVLTSVTILDESLEEFGCSRQALFHDPLELKEIEFTENLNRAREGFVGRQWLFKDLSDSLDQEEFKGVMIIAAPGFGKSALTSNLICSKLSSFSLHTQIVGYHLCIHSHKNTQNGAVFVRNLASMIASRLQEYERLVERDKFIQKVLKHEQCSSDPTGCFEQGILDPLSRLSLRFLKRMYIVVDALDECFNENEQDKGTSIVNILSNNIKHFPNWLKLISTSRNVTNIRRKFSSLNVIDFYPDDPRNLRDIESFIILQKQTKGFLDEDLSMQAMVNKSQGNFLYIKLVLEYLKTKGVDEASWKSLPTSIYSIYQEFFERKFDTKEKFEHPREIFEILVSTLSPLKTEELYDILSTKHIKPFHFDYDFLPMLEDLSMYLSSARENQTVTVFHNSLTEWLTSASNKGGNIYVDEKEGNRLLADYYFKRISGKSIYISTQLVHDLATYVVKGKLPQHKARFKDLNPEIIKTTDSNSNFTALHLASTSDDKNILEILLPFFRNVDRKESNGRTPAFFAVASGNLENLRLLYGKGASLFLVTKVVASPLELNDKFEKIKYCKLQMCGYTLLHVAAQKGRVDVVDFLLQSKLNISSITWTGSSAVHLACEFGHAEAMEALLKHGAAADNLCLYYAALGGKVKAVRLLLENGVIDSCIDCRDMSYDNYTRQCNTALHAAAIEDYPDVLELLLTSKDNAVKCTNYYGRQPLHEAIQNDNYKAANVILSFKVNASSICKFVPSNSLHRHHQSCPCGYTPLHLAAHNGFAAITDLLLKYKADYKATDCEGMQPIHVASCRGHPNILPILVENGADVNSNSSKNLTPLHYACKCHAENVYEILVQLGADGFAKSNNNKTPVYFLLNDRIIDKEYFFIDPYVDKPIDPIDDESASTAPGMHKFKNSWVLSLAKYLESIITLTGDFSKVDALLYQFDLEANFWLKHSTEFLIDLLGRNISNTRILFISSPIVPFVFDMAVGPLTQRNYMDKFRTKTALPSIVKTIIKRTLLNFTCSNLLQLLARNRVYNVDAYIDIGGGVNCKNENGLSPLLAFLRKGGQNMVKVLVKHKVRVDVQCWKFFEDSVFHLAAYHKLHYLQYISVFRDPVKWEEYLKEENAIFDYLFDEYEKIKVGEQVKVRRVRDGPVTKSIKSHPRGYKIIDECLDYEGYTALHRAAQGGNVVAVKHFLDWGADARKESPEGFDALTLAILYAVKYRPYLKLHKPSILTSLEIEFASLTSSIILMNLTQIKAFDVGCDVKKNTPTLLHLAATRGMWRFINDLFTAKNNFKVTGLTANCLTKDHITPMYLAKLHGGDNCERDIPWCNVVGILLKYGASMVYPNKITEYHVIFNAFFHGFPEKLENVISFEDMMNLRDSCGQKECLQFRQGSKSDSNLVPELQQGSQRPCSCSNDLEKVLHDVARKLVVKENDFALVKNDYLNFVSQTIEAIKKLVVAGLIEEKKDDINVCKPMTNKFTKKSVTPSNLDMCSEQTTIYLNEVEATLLTKYRAYTKAHRSLKEELAHVRKILTTPGIEPERYRDLNRACYLFERNYLCDLQSLTFKFAHLKFLLHVFNSWQKQVKRTGRYPSISGFAKKRIRHIFLDYNRKEMIEFMIALSRDDPSKRYGYLEMLKFPKPPIIQDF